MSNTERRGDAIKMPMIPLRGTLVFPGMVTTIDLARDRSIAALKRAMALDQKLFLVAQRDSSVDRPDIGDVFTMGVTAQVKHVLYQPDHTVRIMVEGLGRAILLNVLDMNAFQMAEFIEPAEAAVRAQDAGQIGDHRQKALVRSVRTIAAQLMRLRQINQPELLEALRTERDPGLLCDLAANSLLVDIVDKQAILECAQVNGRLELLLDKLADECRITELEQSIDAKVQERIAQNNHEYYLREQIRAIQDELGDDEDEDVTRLRQRIRAAKLPDEVREHLERELRRLARATVHAPESSVSMNYLEFALSLPWGALDPSDIDISRARKILEADHYGLSEVKDRVVEYLAVRSAASDRLKSPILCLIGPPGVGKTSIARSIARALNRKFTRISLGGVRDEADIRGHRKTYVGAMPGRILSSIRQCGTMNPVFLLDEVDKLTRDLRGDPSSALLEVLDPAQNNAFVDHYLEVAFDLSDVLFITTANSLEPIDPALRDRMEIIEVPSYTAGEKLQIAKRHLLPRQREEHNLTRAQLHLTDKAIEALIDGYTREAGVRGLEREIGKLCRRMVVQKLEHPDAPINTIKPKNLPDYLGAPRYSRLDAARGAEVGLVNGLAWTSVGGEVMPIEALTFPGKGKLKLTGQLGDVMKESAELALSLVRARLAHYGIDADYFETHDVHIHVPEGSVPKDGPSAGVALTCALMSAVTGLRASGDVAMTGEITLRGKVLPIGGVKEKLLAAYRMGITRILLPKENAKDLEKIDADVLEKCDIRLIEDIGGALDAVLISDKVVLEAAI